MQTHTHARTDDPSRAKGRAGLRDDAIDGRDRLPFAKGNRAGDQRAGGGGVLVVFLRVCVVCVGGCVSEVERGWSNRQRFDTSKAHKERTDATHTHQPILVIEEAERRDEPVLPLLLIAGRLAEPPVGRAEGVGHLRRQCLAAGAL